jgi:hypothetical protein
MKLRQLLFVILTFGTLSNGSAQALNKTGQIVPTISAQQAAEIKVNSLKKGTTAQQISDIINNTAKTAIPAGGAEGQVLKIVQGIAVWMDAPQTKTFYADTDGDGYGAINNPILFISLPNGCVANSTDCNDGDSAINPATVWYIGLDTDGDTFFGSVTSLIQCESPGLGYVTTAPTTPDCDDNDATINPNMVWYLCVDADSDTYIGSVTQVIQCESPGVDYALVAPIIEDCNDDEILMNPATVWYLDADSDNYAVATTTQCTSPGAGYTATVLPLGDCIDSDAFINPATIWYLDADGDNYAASTITQCTSPGVDYRAHPSNDGGSWPMPLGDCNDNDLTINPNNYWYLDADSDNFAVSGIRQCTSPGIGYTKTILLVTDCNDNDAAMNPVAVWYLDADGDNYAASSTVQCAFPGVGYTTAVLPLGDCNENDATINPATVWYLDADNDNYAASATIQCTWPGEGYTQTALLLGDCNDSDATINPATVWYLDTDGDNYAISNTIQCSSPGVGYTSALLPLGDCNDNDATMNPVTIWYLDADGDNYATSTTIQCTSPGISYTITVLPMGDCNDNDVTFNPATVWYLDADGDNYAVSKRAPQCANPGSGYTTSVLSLGDCNDDDATINPETTWYLDEGYTTTECVTVSDLLDAGVSVSELVAGGASVSDLLDAGVSVSELVAVGAPVSSLLDVGVSVSELVAGGAPVSSLLDAGAGAQYFIGLSYQGGIIFYIAPISTDLNANGILDRGLIAARNDQSNRYGIQWFNGNWHKETLAKGRAIGTGMANTNAIIASYGGGSYAALLCADYTVIDGGVSYDDWFLPSTDELNLMYVNRVIIGGFELTNTGPTYSSYWSSTTDGYKHYIYDSWYYAWLQSFNTSWSGSGDKDGTYNVRAIRAF